MREAELRKALESLRQKFTSGNDVPVTEARITRAEYEAISDAADGKIKSDESDGVIASAALLYQKLENGTALHKVVAVLIARQEHDDEYDMKAVAERYVNKHLSDQVKGMNLVAYHFAWCKDIACPANHNQVAK